MPESLPWPTRWLSGAERLLLAMPEKARSADAGGDAADRSTHAGRAAAAR